MEYSFTAWGHKNITGKHNRTLEFTKESELSIQGDCILGVSSNFSIYDLKELIREGIRLKMVITAGDISDQIIFDANPAFNDENEIVIRMGDFSSDRTFGIKADKACSYLKKELKDKLNNPEQKIDILITNI
ncbi:DUF371 domain-containing protein [Candidatus Woesearchaeota archaeon]|nr:DUF371 domain-containing protein [Candidatus Woesearchaeota archaeon]